VTHFLLFTPAGSLVMVSVASVVVAVAVWCAMMLAVALVAAAVWRLRRAGYRPGGKT
jgi:hypothetical protein